VDDEQLGALIREAFNLMAAKDREPARRNSSSRRRAR
jgi:hypothetical protein